MLCAKRNTKDNQKKHKTNLNMNAICVKTWALPMSLMVQLFAVIAKPLLQIYRQ